LVTAFIGMRYHRIRFSPVTFVRKVGSLHSDGVAIQVESMCRIHAPILRKHSCPESVVHL